MFRHHATIRLASAIVIGASALGAYAVPAAGAGGREPPCKVRNVTQATSGPAFKPLVDASLDGDVLWVRGTCTSNVQIRTDVTIRGVGVAPTLTGRDAGRVIRVMGKGTVTLRDLTITDGAVGGILRGGGVLVDGVLTIIGSTLVGNRADRGGAVHNKGTLTIIDSVVRGNSAVNRGGGLDNWDTMTITDSIVRGNTAIDGGGIYTVGGPSNGGDMTITGSTIRGNTASVGGGLETNGAATLAVAGSSIRGNTADLGGGFLNDGTLGITGSTVRGNKALDGGGGGLRNTGPLTLTDTVVTLNESSEPGGGILNEGGTVTLAGTSSVTDNTPDDCVGTAAC